MPKTFPSAAADDRRRSNHKYAPPAQSGPPVDATVKWFLADKGYGFVSLADGSGDAFLHVTILDEAEISKLSVSTGAVLRVRVCPSDKGQQVTEVLDVVEAAPAATATRARSVDAPSVEYRGALKWYDPDKGFGFIAVPGIDGDIFLSARTADSAGIRPDDKGCSIMVSAVKQPKGWAAVSAEVCY